MAEVRAAASTLVLLIAAALALGGCGSSGSAAAGGDALATVTGYMQAVASNGPNAGQAFLESHSDEKVTGPTGASTFLADHRGAKWQVVPVNWVAPGSTGQPNPTKNACLVLPPQGGQVCIVTVEIDAGSAKTWFHFNVEKRYGPNWEIINVDRSDKGPDDALPAGPQAHTAG